MIPGKEEEGERDACVSASDLCIREKGRRKRGEKGFVVARFRWKRGGERRGKKKLTVPEAVPGRLLGKKKEKGGKKKKQGHH